jgi:hypothetical protein
VAADELDDGVLVYPRFPWVRAQRDADDYASPTRSVTGGPWLVLNRRGDYVNCLIDGDVQWWLHISVLTVVSAATGEEPREQCPTP